MKDKCIICSMYQRLFGSGLGSDKLGTTPQPVPLCWILDEVRERTPGS